MQIERLADTGEEAVILTASIVDNACTQFGSSKGEGFLGKQSNLSSKFLSFCSGMFSFFLYFSLYSLPPLPLSFSHMDMRPASKIPCYLCIFNQKVLGPVVQS